MRLAKRFIAERLNLLPGVFSATLDWIQPSGGRVFGIGRGTGGNGAAVAGCLNDDLRPAAKMRSGLFENGKQVGVWNTHDAREKWSVTNMKAQG